MIKRLFELAKVRYRGLMKSTSRVLPRFPRTVELRVSPSAEIPVSAAAAPLAPRPAHQADNPMATQRSPASRSSSHIRGLPITPSCCGCRSRMRATSRAFSWARALGGRVAPPYYPRAATRTHRPIHRREKTSRLRGISRTVTSTRSRRTRPLLAKKSRSFVTRANSRRN